MRRISSKATFYFKWVLPIALFAILLFMTAVPVLSMLDSGQSPPLLFYPIIVFFFLIAYLVMKLLVFDLVDGVWDDGDALVVGNGASKDRIGLKDIKNVNYSPLISPPRVTLLLRRKSKFGDKVTFCAPLQFIPFKASPIVDELIDRIDAARNS